MHGAIHVPDLRVIQRTVQVPILVHFQRKVVVEEMRTGKGQVLANTARKYGLRFHILYGPSKDEDIPSVPEAMPACGKRYWLSLLWLNIYRQGR